MHWTLRSKQCDSTGKIWSLHFIRNTIKETRYFEWKNLGYTEGRNECETILWVPNHCGAAEWLRGAPKNPNNVASTFFNTVHLLHKDLSLEHGGANFAPCLGRHLTSLHPWLYTWAENVANE